MRSAPNLLLEPPYRFAHHAAHLAPGVAVHIVPPGGSLSWVDGQAPRSWGGAAPSSTGTAGPA
jgi:hypothetical protein